VGERVLVAHVWVGGPLAGYAKGFAGLLDSRGYTPGSVRLQVHLVAQLSRWLETEGLAVGGLTELNVARFVAARRARVSRLFRSRQALEPVMSYLRDLGVVPAPAPAGVLTAVDELLERYRRYLLVERTVTPGTAKVYVSALRPFIESFERAGRLELERVCAADVSAFVLAETGRRGTSICSVTTALRSLLVFLHVEGTLDRSLTFAVPGTGAWRGAPLPRPLEPGELYQLLASCDQRTGVGCRDYAVVLLMGRLGLRCGEVAALMLENIDWHAGELVVCGKARHDDRLPLPADVGEAIANYLHRGRPVDALDRAVFVRVLAPHHAMGSRAVSRVVMAASQRAGLRPIRAHRLRHTAATDLLRAGASLPDVGQVLRHHKLISTAIYAKVDDLALGPLARSWPEARS
jgi:site-specific recombinase XerD